MLTENGKSSNTDSHFQTLISGFCESFWPGCAVYGAKVQGGDLKSPQRVAKLISIAQKFGVNEENQEPLFLPKELSLKSCEACKFKLAAGKAVIRPINLHDGDSVLLLKALKESFSILSRSIRDKNTSVSNDGEQEHLLPNIIKSPNSKKQPRNTKLKVSHYQLLWILILWILLLRNPLHRCHSMQA